MKHAVREDPDVMLVGEMRDQETFLTAIHAAETGHLVFGTIHASSAATTIGRILDLFPEDMHGQSAAPWPSIPAASSPRSCSSPSSRASAACRPSKSCFSSPIVQKLILEGEDHKLPDAIRIGADDGMQDFTMSLQEARGDDMIDRNTAFSVAPNQEALRMALRGIGVRAAGIL